MNEIKQIREEMAWVRDYLIGQRELDKLGGKLSPKENIKLREELIPKANKAVELIDKGVDYDTYVAPLVREVGLGFKVYIDRILDVVLEFLELAMDHFNPKYDPEGQIDLPSRIVYKKAETLYRRLKRYRYERQELSLSEEMKDAIINGVKGIFDEIFKQLALMDENENTLKK